MIYLRKFLKIDDLQKRIISCNSIIELNSVVRIYLGIELTFTDISDYPKEYCIYAKAITLKLQENE